ncbi:MAG TPA: hypothetical protein VMW27_13630 [Thermoanaerobaculia bacterium]|nr:hypothetical protein [Thermoanaerobaculia bacterium]
MDRIERRRQLLAPLLRRRGGGQSEAPIDHADLLAAAETAAVSLQRLLGALLQSPELV